MFTDRRSTADGTSRHRRAARSATSGGRGPAVVAALLAAPFLGGCAVVGYPSPLDAGPGPAGPAGPTEAAEAARTDSYEVRGRRYSVLASAEGYRETGFASWYGEEFAGRPTSSGEIFDPRALTAAHRSLPLSTWVEVTNLDNGRSVVVRINDRGPFADVSRRIIDLSREAAGRLRMIGLGTARVEVRALSSEEAGGAGQGG